MTIKATVGLGSNWGNAPAIVQRAADELGRLGWDLEMSSLYWSRPQGGPHQPAYCNAVATFRTVWPPHELLALLQAIERRFGRFRRERWGARFLDLDLLLYGSWLFHAPGLTIPHPRLAERRFVLEPLAELFPDLIIPQKGHIRTLLSGVSDQEVQPWPAG